MKKMLDELKKLDVEYKVPADFKSKVMNRIREIDKAEKKENTSKRLTKYVIPCFASVAVMLIACIVTINGGFGSKSTNDATVNQSAMMDTSIGKGNSEISTAPSFAENLKDMFVSEDEILTKRDDGMQSFDSLETQNVVINDINSTASAMPESTGESFASNRVEMTMAKKITSILAKANINVVEISNDYIVVNSDIETVSTLLKDMDDIIISETNEGIKIEFK